MRIVIGCACSRRRQCRTTGTTTRTMLISRAYSCQLQHYTNLRKVINEFRIDVKGQIKRLEGGAKDDLQRKHASLLAFDYEAAARLKAWNDFDGLIKVCKHASQTGCEPFRVQILLSMNLGVTGIWRSRSKDIWLICRYYPFF